MEELSDGRIQCEYGRVGKNMVTVYKNSNEWNKILKSKVSNTKGYTDVTELLTTIVEVTDNKTNNKTEEIKDSIVKQLIDDLMNFANKSIQKNYKVTQDSVSEQQVNAAQLIIDTIGSLLVLGVDKKHVNDMLLKLYTIIPRKMDNVRDHLIEDVNDSNSLDLAQKMIGEEQSTLDTMAGQVRLINQQKAIVETPENKGKQNQVTILDQMGLKIEVENDKETLTLINKLMGSNSSQIRKVYKVINTKTQKTFEDNFSKSKVKKKRLYWHGSRNENWFNIMQTGLLIRPSGAVHTGSMFGDGIYFADKAQKSIGYSSLSGSHWTKGNENRAFLALFDVHVGNQKEILHHTSSCYSLSDSVLKKDGFDSVFAKGGADLRNNEFIVYNGAQCTVSHLIEIGK
jgi:poly [ADP-ribose] polymerase